MLQEIRKIQKSKTGYYINLPKKIAESMKLTGNEIVKIQYNKDTNEIVIKVPNI